MNNTTPRSGSTEAKTSFSYDVITGKICDNQGQYIAMVRDDVPDRIGHLLADAPRLKALNSDMLEALKVAQCILAQEARDSMYDNGKKMVDSAIAKAQGVQS